MRRDELSNEQARIQLAGYIRNFCAAPGAIFSPWDGLDLQMWQGTFYRVENKQRTKPLLNVDDVVNGMSDEAIEQAVLRGKAQ